MKEGVFRKKVVKLLQPWHAIPVENKVYAGTPDVNFSKGWIELKVLLRFGAHCETKPIKIDHFTPQQRIWLAKRSKAGEKTFFFLHVEHEHEFILFDGKTAAQKVGTMTRSQLYKNALGSWKNLSDLGVIQCLTD